MQTDGTLIDSAEELDKIDEAIRQAAESGMQIRLKLLQEKRRLAVSLTRNGVIDSHQYRLGCLPIQLDYCANARFDHK